MGFFRQETGVGCHALLQGISPTQGLNPGILHCRWILHHLNHQGSLNVIQRTLPPPQWLLRSWGNARSKVNKETGRAPDMWDAYERNEFSEPRGLHLPVHKALNSLTWYLIFDIQTAYSLCCKLIYILTSPPTSLEQFSQSYWDAVSWTWSPKHSHQIK